MDELKADDEWEKREDQNGEWKRRESMRRKWRLRVYSDRMREAEVQQRNQNHRLCGIVN